MTSGSFAFGNSDSGPASAISVAVLGHIPVLEDSDDVLHIARPLANVVWMQYHASALYG